MGLILSCPGVGYDSFDQSLDALLKSLSLSNDYIKSSLRSMSFNGRDSEPVLKSWGSGKNLIKKSLSFNKRDKDPFPVEPKLSTKIPNLKEKPEKEKMGSSKNTRFAPVSGKVREPGSPKHKAAVKLQKVYKSFRTRRQLADCAVLVEQRWWKLLDFAMLKRSSVSFFNDEKTESTLSKWSRAKSRAAKVGKGLSKDEKARKLALQHWLEAIDPRHRYGHNLHFYYDRWLRCESKQPFFYWLDVGEGKEVSLDEKCPRSKLQQQCIKYLGPKEREAYEVIVEDGKLLYKKSEQVLDTTEESKDSKWIFVLSTSKNLYVGQKKKGTFQHSSFLAGGATSAAGRLEVKNGILEAIWPHSGHYRPTEENFQEFVTYLKSRNVDLTDVKKSPLEEDEETCSKLKSVPSDLSSSRRKTEESEEHESIASKNPDTSEDSFEKSDKHERASNINMMNNDSEESEEEEETHVKTNDIDSNSNLLVEGQEKAKMPSELILRRMKFRKETLSLQLGKQLSCKWTTGAGPRIGCVRDSPSELRFRALEEVNLSPRSDGANPRAWSASRNLPSPLNKAQGTSSTSKEIERGKSDDR